MVHFADVAKKIAHSALQGLPRSERGTYFLETNLFTFNFMTLCLMYTILILFYHDNCI